MLWLCFSNKLRYRVLTLNAGELLKRIDDVCYLKPTGSMLNKIILKNFRPEPPPSVDRSSFFISGVVPS